MCTALLHVSGAVMSRFLVKIDFAVSLYNDLFCDMVYIVVRSSTVVTGSL
jgi:hypothetical protein